MIRREKLKAEQTAQLRATKRLMKDYTQVKKEPLRGIAAAPLEKDLFVWHINILGPKDTAWEGAIFHMVMTFPRSYPDDPPRLTLSTRINHPNVIGSRVCLDILSARDSNDAANPEMGGSWSPLLSVQSILVALQAFLFEADVSVVLQNIDDPKQYNRAKEEWYAAVRWSVEQSLHYQDSTVNHHPPRKPWPPFPTESELDHARERLREATKDSNQINKDELVCFYTKRTFEEEVLGFPLNYSKNLRTGDIRSITCPDMNFVSLRAFMTHHVRKTASNETFTNWIPVLLDPDTHGKKAMHLAKRSISIICTGSAKNFTPMQVVASLPKLMSTLIVEMASGRKHSSVRVFHVYCLIHRLLLEFCREYPQVRESMEQQVAQFVEDPKMRHKDHTPNLGEFLCMASCVVKHSFKDICEVYFEESAMRSVFWLLNRYPELENLKSVSSNGVTDEDRLRYTLEHSRPGYKLLVFHSWFLSRVARMGTPLTERIHTHDKNFGYPPIAMEDEFLSLVQKFDNVKDFHDLFKMLGISKYNTDQLIVSMLKDAIVMSKQAGYHGIEKKKHLSPEEFARQNQKMHDLSALIDKQTGRWLNDDESKWREQVNILWGITDLPAYLNNVEHPWRNLFLQHNLQTITEMLNDVPDFARFHMTCDLSTEIVQLELSMFSPTQIKSRFHFLTVILTKLKNLRTLVIRKGESALGVNGFKALLKGLSNNPGNLTTLVLSNCGIDEHAIEELTKGSLISSNLKSINFVSNPLHGAGACKLAGFLRRHENLPHLSELDLSYCSIDARGIGAIAECLLVKRELKNIRCVGNPGLDGMEKLIQNVAYSPSVERLNISDSNIKFHNTESSLGKMIDLSLSLKEVNLWRVAAVADLHPKVFSHSLRNNKAIKSLDLAETRLNNEVKLAALGTALAHNIALTKLSLSGNNITMRGLTSLYSELVRSWTEEQKAIFEASHRSVDQSNIDDADTDDSRSTSSAGGRRTRRRRRGQHQVIDIAPPVVHLEWLDLSRNVLQAYVDREKTTLGSLIDLCKHLVYLDLSHSKIDGRVLGGLAKALLPANKVPLATLNLRGNSAIGQFGLADIVSTLQQNTSIKALDISGCDLEVRGAKLVADILSENQGITDLNLYGNFMEIEGCVEICNVLKQKNSTLKHLDLGMNRIRARGGAAVAEMLEENTTLESILLKVNHLPDKTALDIVRAIEKEKSLVKRLSLAGNMLSVTIRSELAVMLRNVANRNIHFDMSKLVEVKDPERQNRTVYITPLPNNVTVQMIKKFFQADSGCGYVASVSIHKHKKKLTRTTSNYAFVEFQDPASVELAVHLVHQRKNLFTGNTLHIAKAGIQQLEE